MHIVEKFRYYLIGIVDDITEIKTVDSANISYNSLSTLKESANVSITLMPNEEIDVNKKLKIVHCKNDVETTVGTFFFTTPVQNVSAAYKVVDVTCYSTLWLLSINKTTGRLIVAKGTNVVNEVKRIINSLNLDITLDILDSDKSTSVLQEFEIGTPYIDVCNQLLSCINYTSLYVNQNGDYIAKPYIQSDIRPIDITYNENDEESQIECLAVSELDYFDIPNVFVRYVNNPEAQNLIAVYKNENPSSPTSTANRPTNVDSQEVNDAADVQTLYDMCKRDCMDATNTYNIITFSTSINPKHNYMDCIYLNLNGVRGKIIETEWSFTCEAGASMQHIARRVVSI